MYRKEIVGADGGPQKAIGLLLAMMASVLSVGIALMAVGHFPGDAGGAWLMSGVGIMAVLGAHLLPALCRRMSLGWQLFGAVVWAACSLYVIYGYSSFFLSMQEEAGQKRLAALEQSLQMIDSATSAESKRSISAILSEVAAVKTQRARVNLVDCAQACSMLKARDVALGARIAALEAEESEVRSWQMNQHRLSLKKEAVQQDAFTEKLAQEIGLSNSQVGLAIGVLFAVILEGMGGLCWLAVLNAPRRQGFEKSQTKATESVVAATEVALATTESRAPIAVPSASISPDEDYSVVVTADETTGATCMIDAEIESRVREDGAARVANLVEQVRREVESRRLKCVVNDIRRYLRCSQATACEVRRRLLLPAALAPTT